MREINLVELLSSRETKVTRLKSEAYLLVEEKCKEDNLNISVYITNAILEKLEKDGIIRLV